MVEINIWTSPSEEFVADLIYQADNMPAILFLRFIRDEVGSLPSSAIGKGLPSNAELRDRWLTDKIVLCNGEILTRKSIVRFPITELVFFPNNPKRRCTQV